MNSSFYLKIGVNAEWVKEQQHQIKYEVVLFLQEKTDKENNITVSKNNKNNK